MSNSTIEKAQVADRETLEARHDLVREQLKELYACLDANWRRAEESFAKCHLPRPVEHVCLTHEKDFPTVCVSLFLERIDKQIRLYVTRTVEDFPEQNECWRITDAPIEYRVRLVEYLPALREAVIKSIEDFKPEVDNAIEKLDSVLLD